MSEKIQKEITTLQPDGLVSLYILDLSKLGGDLFRYYPGVDANSAPIVFQTFTYVPIAMEVRGFEFKSAGAPPRPSLILQNHMGAFSSLCLNYNDLIGAKVIRKRTFQKFLDGQPTADPIAEFPEDHFYVERKTAENKFSIEFELASSIDVDTLSLPKRTIYSNICGWNYRGPECSFAGTYPVADQFNVKAPVGMVSRGQWSPTTPYYLNNFVWVDHGEYLRYYWCWYDNGGAGIVGQVQGPPNGVFWKSDQCGKQINSCQMRFGKKQLPFGAFPATQKFPF